MNAVERAEKLGVSLVEYVAIATADSRIVADVVLAEPGAVARIKAWLAVGTPEPDLSTVEFRGADSARAVVLEVLRRVPRPVAHYAATSVCFVEVGRGTLGWQGPKSVEREQIVALNGKCDDDTLARVCAHELGHGFARSIDTIAPSTVHLAYAEAEARLESIGVTRDELRRADARSERQADNFAELWGFRRHHHH